MVSPVASNVALLPISISMYSPALIPVVELRVIKVADPGVFPLAILTPSVTALGQDSNGPIGIRTHLRRANGDINV